MRVLLTGGSGYIGTRLMRALSARGDVEEIVDVDPRAPGEVIPKVRHVARSVTDDLRDLFASPAPKIDVALHLAWVLEPMADGQRQRAVCIGGTQRFLDACTAGGVDHVLFVSSATAFGASPENVRPLDEDEPLRDRHHFQYSAEKREAEGLFRRWAADRPSALLQIARPCIVGGPNVSNYIFRAMDRPLSFRALGHDPPMQLVHEDDCAAALAAIIDRRLPGVFHIAGDGTLRVSEIYRRLGVRVVPLPLLALLHLAGLAWERGWRNLIEAPRDFVHFTVHPWVVSTRRLRDEVGFCPRHTTEEVLASYMAAHR